MHGACMCHTQVGLPASPSEPPVAVLSSSFDSLDATRQVDTRWVCGRELVAEQLEQLKRAYWSWDWPLVRYHSFTYYSRATLKALHVNMGSVNHLFRWQAITTAPQI